MFPPIRNTLKFLITPPKSNPYDQASYYHWALAPDSGPEQVLSHQPHAESAEESHAHDAGRSVSELPSLGTGHASASSV